MLDPLTEARNFYISAKDSLIGASSRPWKGYGNIQWEKHEGNRHLKSFLKAEITHVQFD